MQTRRRSRLMDLLLYAGMGILALALGRGVIAQDWRTASHEPVGLAPDPATTLEAVVQVYAARTWGWKGNFGVHTWVAVKPREAPAYTVYEVIGWRLRRGGTVLVVSERNPDAHWFGNAPEVLAERRGAEAEAIIPKIEEAVKVYPYANEYSVFPGPNSNTFTAWIARAVPELRVDLPPTAIGKDFIGDRIVASAPSGSGVQISLGGLFALTASGVEGLEVNLLGLTFGIDPFSPALRLPLIGRIGAAR
jgi:uncharacterized protein DUF3750